MTGEGMKRYLNGSPKALKNQIQSKVYCLLKGLFKIELLLGGFIKIPLN